MSNQNLVRKLSRMWNEVKQNLYKKETAFHEMQTLHADFQEIHIQHIQDKIVKQLIVEAVHTMHVN